MMLTSPPALSSVGVVAFQTPSSWLPVAPGTCSSLRFLTQFDYHTTLSVSLLPGHFTNESESTEQYIWRSLHLTTPHSHLLYVDVSHLSFLNKEQIADSCSEIDKCGMLQFAAKRQGISIYSPTLDHALIQPIWVYSMQQQLG